MTNPRREPQLLVDENFLKAFASINDCRYVAILLRNNDTIIGYLYKVMLSLSGDNDELVRLGYILYLNRVNKCTNNISVDSLLYICREENKLILVIDREDVFTDILKCINIREKEASEKSPKIICLYAIEELSEKLGCITAY
ncbi:hypothetical protein PYJP_09080 [Pyrofollis japonicus]|uniref:hypothetical protein n=1 Tax=Pyrofollis japonicus TaxID=3060460 RepID=UPI00295B80A3|nr:hypothetical protein [Pyrofollis japonicus]BEP17556.1 hypothetical protein PYJP_09080 [Pyrofollis japonicus]